jgi:SNF2 family DNA or RNA helicase
MIHAEVTDGSTIRFLGSGLEIIKLRSLLNLHSAGWETTRSHDGSIYVEIDRLLAIPEPDLSFIDMPERMVTSLNESRLRIVEHLTAVANIPRILSGELAFDRELQVSANLKSYQYSAVMAITQAGLRGVCLFDEQGTGKTVMAISAFATMRFDDQIDGAVVVAPKTLLAVWKKEFETFAGTNFKVVEITGAPQRRMSQIYEPADVHLISYESNISDLVLVSSLFTNRRTLLVVDESHHAKNLEAQRTKALVKDRNSVV